MSTEPSISAADAAAFTLARVRIVLVGTQHPGNMGSAARAMKTMGLSRLVLVAPETAPNAESFALAAGADDVLASAVTCSTLAEAIADCTQVYGCTARSRRIALEELMPRVAADRVRAEAEAGGEIAVVFGRERTGLNNDELQLCHAAVHIPANPGYSSLNLAAAVQVLSYELRLAALGESAAAPAAPAAVPPDASARREPPASHAQLEGLFGQLGDTLDAIDFHKGRAPEAAMRKLRRLFLRAGLDEREVRLLRGVLSDAQRMASIATRGD
ncbi:RNA methyltransferase [Cognatilysobacter bugurensis]|uniref:tRNA (cytidine/uridine-2'-O-)-methyltransferase TrmJ n=1 Tax=Cognatilysobacter bugurensis TaxID=543356 RepID=A0A918SWR2_9GAMM|nr:RNA methyltransferase [Lysobacter bugurensis]GHA75831.1 tRNA (cytidine/uridine-2'-O-)-methyltransferase TrmJ [Lysobacter bugurensis]